MNRFNERGDITGVAWLLETGFHYGRINPVARMPVGQSALLPGSIDNLLANRQRRIPTEPEERGARYLAKTR